MKRGPHYKLVLLCCILGIVVSAELLHIHVKINNGLQHGASFCTFHVFDCDQVARSSYAKFLKIPVASYALWCYLILLSFALYFRKPETEALFFGVLFAGSALALLPAIYLFLISIFVIGAPCLLCIVLDLVNIALLLVSWRYIRAHGGVRTFFHETFRRRTPPLQLINRRSTLLIASLLVCGWMITLVPDFLFRVVYSDQGGTSSLFAEEIFDEWRAAPKVTFASESAGDSTLLPGHGPLDAPIQVVEFSDFECPHCKRAAATFREILSEYSESVHLVFRNYPLDAGCNRLVATPFHHYACKAAYLTVCALERGGVDLFWRTHDELFALERLNDQMLREVATRVDIAPEEFERCMEAEDIHAKVRRDLEQGYRLRLDGTPSIFINNKRIRMADPAALKKVFAYILGGGK